MRLRWHGRWLETPRYNRVEGSWLVAVEATVAIAPVQIAGGRVIERPGRKVATFLRTDGLRATIRKARSKRSEDAYLGDYWTSLVLGQAGGNRVVALALRMPSSAEWVLVHERLCASIDEAFDAAELERSAARLGSRVDELGRLGEQTYFYSDSEPPNRLVEILHEAIDQRGERGEASAWAAVRPAIGGSKRTLIVRHSDDGEKNGVPLAVLGAGDYVRIEVRPALRRAGLRRTVICDREPQVAALAAAALDFTAACSDPLEAIAALPGPGIVVVATNHDSHAELAAVALEAGHRVFLEKPTIVTAADQDRLLTAADRFPGKLEVGFNRRYNPLVRRAAAILDPIDAPRTITAVIREVTIEPHHWYLWANQGTRVAGNLCHWIDLAHLLVGERGRPVSVSLSGRVDDEPGGADAERAFTFEFDDGSVATLVATSRGDGIRGVQERIDVRCGDLSLHLDDLWRLEVMNAGTMRRHRTLWRDKGHQTMYREALGRFVAGTGSGYGRRDLELVGAAQLAATELVLSGASRASITTEWLSSAADDPRDR